MFISVCGWIFCIAIFIGLVLLAIEAIRESMQIEYLVRCDPKENNGVCGHHASGTWYGWHLKTTTNQRKIIWKKFLINCGFCMLPLIWTCIVIIFAV